MKSLANICDFNMLYLFLQVTYFNLLRRHGGRFRRFSMPFMPERRTQLLMADLLTFMALAASLME